MATINGFTYPTNSELIEIAQDKLPRLTQDRLGFRICPIVNSPAAMLEWEQPDNYTGLQQLRGYDNSPYRIKPKGMARWSAQPGAYGEFRDISETELTLRRQYGTYGTPIDISDLVMESQDWLLQRRLDRIEATIWGLLGTGAFSVLSNDGQTIHADQYSLQTYAALTPWSTTATATPLADFRAIQLKSRGHSVAFDQSAMAIVNRVTANNILANTNQADIYGKRTAGVFSINLSIPDVNAILTGEGLPNIVVYDELYLTTGAAPLTNGPPSYLQNLFVPNNTCIIVGRRPGGQVVMDYATTRNANNPDLASGPYMMVVDTLAVKGPPRSIQVHDGHNGGPRFFYPSAAVVMSV